MYFIYEGKEATRERVPQAWAKHNNFLSLRERVFYTKSWVLWKASLWRSNYCQIKVLCYMTLSRSQWPWVKDFLSNGPKWVGIYFACAKQLKANPWGKSIAPELHKMLQIKPHDKSMTPLTKLCETKLYSTREIAWGRWFRREDRQQIINDRNHHITQECNNH